MKERREILEKLIQDYDEPRLKISSCLSAESKESLEILRNSSRDFGAEGLMLKKRRVPIFLEENVGIGGNIKSIR